MKLKNILFDLLSIPSESGKCNQMIDFVVLFCKMHGYSYCFDQGNIYITKGESETYPCIVAHLDTVHKIEDGGIQPIQIGDFITGINPETMKQTGIGGDDKCGIYAALVCLTELPVCKAAFFIDEEIGCIGSQNAHIPFFRNCRFALQADRRGNSDFVTDINGPLSSKKFKKDVGKIIKSYGFSFCDGLMTDVEALRNNGVGISVANISAGYYRPHCKDEYISVTDLNRTIQMMLDICRNMVGIYKFTPDLFDILNFHFKSYNPINDYLEDENCEYRTLFEDYEGSFWTDDFDNSYNEPGMKYKNH